MEFARTTWPNLQTLYLCVQFILHLKNLTAKPARLNGIEIITKSLTLNKNIDDFKNTSSKTLQYGKKMLVTFKLLQQCPEKVVWVSMICKAQIQQTHQCWINVKTTFIVNVHSWADLHLSTLFERWNNVDRITSIQSRWTNVVSTLKFDWKWKLSLRIFTGVVSTLTKQCW